MEIKVQYINQYHFLSSSLFWITSKLIYDVYDQIYAFKAVFVCYSLASKINYLSSALIQWQEISACRTTVNIHLKPALWSPVQRKTFAVSITLDLCCACGFIGWS